MTWRALATPQDRMLAAFPYLLPLYYALDFGITVLEAVPQLATVLLPLLLPIGLLHRIPFSDLVIFVALFLLVVRNTSISYFIRYNTMQATLIGIALSLVRLLMSALVMGNVLNLLPGFALQVFLSFVFLTTFALVIYAVVQCLRGIYAEFPTISDAAKRQLS